MYTSDQEVIEAIKLGNQNDNALKWVYHECTPIIKQLGWNYSLSVDDCMDVLQDAIIVFWEKVTKNEFALTAKISTYIYQICKNQFNTKNRDSKKAVLVDINLIEETYEEEYNEDLYISNSVKLAMYLNELGEGCRNLIKEFYSGTSMKDLALRFNYSNPETATAQKHKCLKQLRKKFDNTLSK